MAHQTVVHGTLTLHRRFGASIARVWAAFEDPAARAIWSSPGEGVAVRVDQADFRVGGLDASVCVVEGVDAYWVDARYYALQQPTRLVFTETIATADGLLGVSLCTVELSTDGPGTLLSLTIQTAALDGSGLEQGVAEGWGSALDSLARLLADS